MLSCLSRCYRTFVFAPSLVILHCTTSGFPGRLEVDAGKNAKMHSFMLKNEEGSCSSCVHASISERASGCLMWRVRPAGTGRRRMRERTWLKTAVTTHTHLCLAFRAFRLFHIDNPNIQVTSHDLIYSYLFYDEYSYVYCLTWSHSWVNTRNLYDQ